MKRDLDVLIVGAGIAGLSMAGLLASDERTSQLRITVADAGRRPAFDAASDTSLRVSAIAPGSVAALRRIGMAWPRIAGERICPYRKMEVWDETGYRDGPETLSFDAADFALPELGFIVENVLLQHELIAELESSTVSFRFESPIARLAATGSTVSVDFASGERAEPDLLIAADGARSFVRQHSGIALRSMAHRQKAFVTHLASEQAHQNIALQRFMTDGPIGILPLRDGRVSIVWSTAPQRADAAMELPAAKLCDLMTSVTDMALGALHDAGPRGTFPLSSQHASAYVMPRIALLGDAAHAIHPLAGQGANLGIADAVALADVIANALERDEHPGDLPVLRRYERARKGANTTMLYFVSGLNRLFSNPSRTLSRLRGNGMYAFNHSGPVRRKFVKTALGVP